MYEHTESLVNSILTWWKDAEFFTTGDRGEWNVFDEPPEFVTKALEFRKASTMKCHKCGSINLAIVKSGPHNKLVCVDCLAFQKFLNAGETRTFLALQAKTKEVTS